MYQSRHHYQKNDPTTKKIIHRPTDTQQNPSQKPSPQKRKRITVQKQLYKSKTKWLKSEVESKRGDYVSTHLKLTSRISTKY